VDGHYGLFKKFYAHFTSPIRRYSDLVVHRIFDAFLARQGHTSSASVVRYDHAELHQLGRHLSLTERNSTDAERETVKLKLLEFFEREAKREPRQPFRARITDVRNYGFFVELSESMAYGFVPFSSIADDLYFVSGDGREASGRRTKRCFTLGAEIMVEVLRVDRFKRQIDFRVVSEAGGTTMKPGGAPSSRPLAPARRHGPRQAGPQRSHQQPREGQRRREGGRNRQRRRR
jgi:ribonuclease R